MRRDDPQTPDGFRTPDPADRVAVNADSALRRIGAALDGLRYGSVLVIVQDGVVVQIERTEKTRFSR